MNETLLLIGISLLAALVNGITGFGFGLIAMPVLLLIMPVGSAVVVVNMVALFVCAHNLWTVRESINWRETWPVLGSAFPAAVAGVYILKVVDASVLEALLAATLLFGCVVALWSPKRTLVQRAFPWGYLAGVAGGVIGGALATGGPPVVLYCLLRGWQKGEAKAMLSAYFAIIAIWRLVLLVAGNLVTWELVRWGALALLPALAASVLGASIFKRLSMPAFRYATMAVLVGMAIKLVIS